MFALDVSCTNKLVALIYFEINIKRKTCRTTYSICSYYYDDDDYYY